MEAKHKIKEKVKRYIKEEVNSSSSDADDLSDFEEVVPKVMQESSTVQSKTYFTPESKSRRLVVILDNASLETAQTKRGYELLNKDDHYWLIKKRRRDPEEFRPDTVHQTLMALLDSPLNK